jgi:hypothetical protein
MVAGQGGSRATIAAALLAAVTLVWWVGAASAVARDIDALGGRVASGAGAHDESARTPSPEPLREGRRGESRRLFVVPPGHDSQPAREVAPGRRRAARPQATPSPGPTGEVLGATPGPVAGGVPLAPRAPRPSVAIETTGRFAPGQTEDSVPAAFAARQVRSAGLAGALLSIGAIAPSRSAADLGASPLHDPLASALLLLVVAAQVFAALGLIPLAWRVFGGFGLKRLR